MTDVAKIAAGLTKAQREAVLSCFQDAKRHAPYHAFPNTAANRKAWRDLISCGFVTSEDGGFDLVVTRERPLALVCLTALGLAVRKHLKGPTHEQD